VVKAKKTKKSIYSLFDKYLNSDGRTSDVIFLYQIFLEKGHA